MSDLLHGADVTWEVCEPPETTPLRASIDAFTAALAAAHPCIFSRAPVCDTEDLAALLHMSLDQCRHLLAAYESLLSTNAVWLVDSPGVDETDEAEEETQADDLPF